MSTKNILQLCIDDLNTFSLANLQLLFQHYSINANDPNGLTKLATSILQNSKYSHAKMSTELQEFFNAVMEEDSDEILKILKIGQVKINDTNDSGNTVLGEYLNSHDNPDIVKLLLENGADPNSLFKLNDTEYTPLMLVAGASNFAEENGYGNVLPIMKMLIDAGANVNVKNTDYGPNTAFLYALNYSDFEEEKPKLEMIKLLINSGADINSTYTSLHGGTALLAELDTPGLVDTKIVELLINSGANVNIPDNNGYTPLMYAVVKELEDIVKLLIKKGANLNIQDNKGYTALMYALNKYKLDRNSRIKSQVYNCIKNKNIINILVNAGTDLTLENNDGQTALALAKKSCPEILECYFTRQ